MVLDGGGPDGDGPDGSGPDGSGRYFLAKAGSTVRLKRSGWRGPRGLRTRFGYAMLTTPDQGSTAASHQYRRKQNKDICM